MPWCVGSRTIVVAALLACLAKGLLASWATPPFQTPDEYGHYDYALYLSHIDPLDFLAGRITRPTAYHDITTDELWAVTRATGTELHLRGSGRVHPLPGVRQQLAAGATFIPSDTHETLRRATVVPAQFNYPVLYYGSVAVLVKGVRLVTPNPVAAYYVARTASLGLLLLTVWFAWRTATVVFADVGHGPPAVALSTLLVALHPQLTMLGTSVQSDMLTVLLVTVAGWYAARLATTPSVRDSTMLAVVTGALLLTKLHAALVVGVAASALLAWPPPPPHGGVVRWRGTLTPLVRFWVLVGLIGGWWYVRSYLLSGSPTGMVVGEFRTQPFGTPRQNASWWLGMWRLTFQSYWGYWGWLEVPLPAWCYRLLAGASVLSAILAIGGLLGALRHRLPAARRLVFWVAMASGYVAIMAVVAVVIGPAHNNQGRHWLPIVMVPALTLGWCAATAEAIAGRLASGGIVAAWIILLSGANILLVLGTMHFYG